MNIFLVAGEASGDLHAANLVRALRLQEPAIRVFGVGGERLREAGLECVARSEELSVMGLAEVVKDLPRILRLSRRVRAAALAGRPDVAVLVDSPDFNLPLARHLRRAGIGDRLDDVEPAQLAVDHDRVPDAVLQGAGQRPGGGHAHAAWLPPGAPQRADDGARLAGRLDDEQDPGSHRRGLR